MCDILGPRYSSLEHLQRRTYAPVDPMSCFLAGLIGIGTDGNDPAHFRLTFNCERLSLRFSWRKCLSRGSPFTEICTRHPAFCSVIEAIPLTHLNYGKIIGNFWGVGATSKSLYIAKWEVVGS